MKWVMLVSGILTFTMFYGLFAPQAALESMFGVSFGGPLEDIIVRSWSALIGLVGVILIYGAFSETNRMFAISVAAFSKTIFVSLLLLYGQEYLDKAVTAIVMDSLIVLLSVIYLIAVRIQQSDHP